MQRRSGHTLYAYPSGMTSHLKNGSPPGYYSRTIRISRAVQTHLDSKSDTSSQLMLVGALITLVRDLSPCRAVPWLAVEYSLRFSNSPVRHRVAERCHVQMPMARGSRPVWFKVDRHKQPPQPYPVAAIAAIAAACSIVCFVGFVEDEVAGDKPVLVAYLHARKS
eukprot:SAG22_NODE_76_length_22248_cov_14.352070_13_plen_165_part_00